MHKQVVNHLFVMLFTSPNDEDEIAKEFYRAYRHLVESRPLDELRFALIDRNEFLQFFHAVKSAGSDDTDTKSEARDEQHDRNSRRDPGKQRDDDDFDEE